MIKVKNLYHDYTGKGKYAVTDLSFEIGKGEIFGFLGPSGAGKSTVQNIMTGLLPIQTGDVLYGNESVRQLKPDFFNKIGVSFEHPNLYTKLSGYENLKYFAGLFDVPTQDPIKLLDMVGLRESADKKAVFLTTHNMAAADELCDRVAFLCDGKISAMDTPRNLKLKYGDKSIKVEYTDHGMTATKVLFPGKEEDKAQLQDILNNRNIETIHSQEATLEQIFIQLTGRGLE